MKLTKPQLYTLQALALGTRGNYGSARVRVHTALWRLGFAAFNLGGQCYITRAGRLRLKQEKARDD